MDAGLVLSFSVQSNHCHACSLGPKAGEEGHEQGTELHKEACQKTFNGSSNAMKVEAAGLVVQELYKMQHTTVFCDGGTKPFLHVSKMSPIVKEDCINHVTKRVFSGIENTKKKANGPMAL